MKDSFYFSHDYNARNDEKVVKMLSKEGWAGYGLYWALAEKLYEAGGYLEKDYESIAFDLRTDSERIKKIVEEYKLFELSAEKFSSKTILARLKERKLKSEKARKSATIKWDKHYANAKRPLSERSAIKERKGKEIKGKERKEEIEEREVAIAPPPSQVNKEFFERGEIYNKALTHFSGKFNTPTLELSAELDKFISYWTELNKSGTKQRWQMEKTFELKRRLATWFGNVNKFGAKPVKTIKSF